jgi:hypothetical protein
MPQSSKSSPIITPETLGSFPTAIALYAYNSKDTTKLSFKAGDTIYIASKHASGWWNGCVSNPNTKSLSIGWFPASYVQEQHFTSDPSVSSVLGGASKQQDNIPVDPSPKSLIIRTNQDQPPKDRSTSSLHGRASAGMSPTVDINKPLPSPDVPGDGHSKPARPSDFLSPLSAKEMNDEDEDESLQLLNQTLQDTQRQAQASQPLRSVTIDEPTEPGVGVYFKFLIHIMIYS